MYDMVRQAEVQGIKTHQEHADEMFYKFPYKLFDRIQDRQFAGKRCFIVGGGASLVGFDYSLLKEEFTIGINKAIQFFDPKIWYTMDYDLIRKILSGTLGKTPEEGLAMVDIWRMSRSIKTFLSPFSVVDIIGEPLYAIRRVQRAHQKMSFSLEYGLCGGNNSGFGALELAVCLGCNPIYLLGFDMKVKEVDGIPRTHFHNGYPYLWDAEQQAAIKDFKIRTESYIQGFREVRVLIENAGVKVFNLCDDSALDCFEVSTIKEVLNVHSRS